MISRLALTLLIASAVAACLLPSIAEKRLDTQVRRTLLTVQAALQDYHVKEELYPQQTPMTGAQLISLLIESGHLEAPPRNPWTGASYEVVSGKGTGGQSAPGSGDRIRYRTDELAETYTLEALRRDSDEVHHLLDSTEHPSLE